MNPTAAYATTDLPPLRQTEGWTQRIARSYFPLDLEYRSADRFDGRLRLWSLGDVQASRLNSDAVMYRRRRDHLRDAGEEEFLLTIPRAASVRFEQLGREVICAPGGFIIERGNEPYEFSYSEGNDLIVAKIGYRQLADRLPDPGRYCAMEFDGETGVGALLVDFLRASGTHASQISDDARENLGRQVIDLLALAIERDPRAVQSSGSTVRCAHLRRINSVIASTLADADLSPGGVARACGISVRYLHDLCGQDGPTFGERLREARLMSAHRMLSSAVDIRSITDIAFGCGFNDASSFSRAYRARFDVTPRATRAAAQLGKNVECDAPKKPRK